MDLKELFGKQPNYVQFPPEEAPTLEKFIAERAMIPHNATSSAEQDSKKIPNMFGGSLMPSSGMEYSAYSAPKSAIDSIDPDTKLSALESDPMEESRLAEIKGIFGIKSPMEQRGYSPLG